MWHISVDWPVVPRQTHRNNPQQRREQVPGPGYTQRCVCVCCRHRVSLVLAGVRMNRANAIVRNMHTESQHCGTHGVALPTSRWVLSAGSDKAIIDNFVRQAYSNTYLVVSLCHFAERACRFCAGSLLCVNMPDLGCLQLLL